MLVLLGRPREPDLAQALNKGLASLLADEPTADDLFVALHNAFELMEARARAEQRGKWMNRFQYELGEVIECARAIETERDIDKLLGVILRKSRFITGADAGSIYVVDNDAAGQRQLRFKLSQNDSVKFDSREFTMPLSPRSMAGASALHGTPINIVDVYDMPRRVALRVRSLVRREDRLPHQERALHAARLARRRGHRRHSAHQQEARQGEAPLLRRRRGGAGHRLRRAARGALRHARRAGGHLAGERRLLEEIRRIFEGFVNASVEAIESRDPTTSGHSRRVADLTVGLAKAVERVETGPYRDVIFSAEDLREIEYASLLHDFGKIGVREHVLVKAKKLYPAEFELIRAALRAGSPLARGGRALAQGALRAARGAGRRDRRSSTPSSKGAAPSSRDAFRAIESANEPTVLKARRVRQDRSARQADVHRARAARNGRSSRRSR